MEHSHGSTEFDLQTVVVKVRGCEVVTEDTAEVGGDGGGGMQRAATGAAISGLPMKVF